VVMVLSKGEAFSGDFVKNQCAKSLDVDPLAFGGRHLGRSWS
jgi:hypothetical protein